MRPFLNGRLLNPEDVMDIIRGPIGYPETTTNICEAFLRAKRCFLDIVEEIMSQKEEEERERHKDDESRPSAHGGGRW